MFHCQITGVTFDGEVSVRKDAAAEWSQAMEPKLQGKALISSNCGDKYIEVGVTMLSNM